MERRWEKNIRTRGKMENLDDFLAVLNRLYWYWLHWLHCHWISHSTVTGQRYWNRPWCHRRASVHPLSWNRPWSHRRAASTVNHPRSHRGAAVDDSDWLCWWCLYTCTRTRTHSHVCGRWSVKPMCDYRKALQMLGRQRKTAKEERDGRGCKGWWSPQCKLASAFLVVLVTRGRMLTGRLMREVNCGRMLTGSRLLQMWKVKRGRMLTGRKVKSGRMLTGR